MKITLVGSGYVGLVTGACFAEFGYHVTCVDVNAQRINDLNKGIIPIYEPGLDSLVHQGMKGGRLHFTTDLGPATQDAQVVMIAVGTPSRRGDGHADLTYVFQAAAQIAENIKDYTVVVTKSTVPVGTSRQVAEIIKTTRPDLIEGEHFDVASNPEFLREGSAIGDFMRPDRVVVGVNSEKAREVMHRLYRPLSLIEKPVLFTSPETSELIKYAANGFLAMKIAFINEVGDLCEKVGADVQDVARGIGLDGRIGRHFLNVGPGYGGSCFPKDTLALSKTAHDFNSPITLIDTVIKANAVRKENMAEKILHHLSLQGDVHNQTVAILGITFKPNTDDLRDAASLVIIPRLIKQGVHVRVYDPLFNKSNPSSMEEFKGVEWMDDAYSCSEGANGVVILTEWNQFRALDLDRLDQAIQNPSGPKPLLIDLRNIYKPLEMKKFNYVSLGRRHG